MTIEHVLQERGITELLHFTTNHGVVGTLAAKALFSRYKLPSDKFLEHILHVNSANRPESGTFFDKSQNWLDYVNLSISEINVRYFSVSQRWHLERHVWWGILSFDSIIATHEGVVFATTNNSYDLCIRASGRDGLEALFAKVVARKKSGCWSVTRAQRSPALPTCEQAEVLYQGAVSTDYLRKIYVREEEHHDTVSGWLAEFGFPDVEVVLSSEKFVGKRN